MYNLYQFTFIVLISDVPEVPRDLRVSHESSRDAIVSWAAPLSPNTPITHYVLHIKPSQG